MLKYLTGEECPEMLDLLVKFVAYKINKDFEKTAEIKHNLESGFWI